MLFELLDCELQRLVAAAAAAASVSNLGFVSPKANSLRWV